MGDNSADELLSEYTVDRAEEVVLNVTATTNANFKLVYTTMGAKSAKFNVSAIKLIEYDEVQDSYVSWICNEDEVGGKDYRFGFNGQHKDNEIKGIGNSLDMQARMFDPRLGRFFSIDPIVHEYMSPYAFPNNNPIMYSDPTGCTGEDKGKINVSFYPADATKGTPDACGADNDKNKKDDCLESFDKTNKAANNLSNGMATFGIKNRDEIGQKLQQLRDEGYTIGNVILNAHAGTNGDYYLGGKADFNSKELQQKLIDNLKPNLSSSSAVILNSCNIGAGDVPNKNKATLQNLSNNLGCPVLASMSFGSGVPLTGNVMSTKMPIGSYAPGGKRAGYPNSTILCEGCYLLTMHKPVLGIRTSIVANVRVSQNGAITFSNPSTTLAENRSKLFTLKLLGRQDKGGTLNK